MTFDEKKKRAFALMAQKKMWSCNYEPPLFRLLWKLGSEIPPPPFAPFWLNTLFSSVTFGFIWGLFMWLFSWNNTGYSPLIALERCVITGLLFGVAMALFYYWRKRANNLPDWNSL